MKLNTYVLLQSVTHILRALFSLIFIGLSFVIPLLRDRRLFELKNSQSIHSHAHACFHVSSEGELEQCLYLIEDLLKNDKIIELVYTSPSVERKCTELDKKYSNLKVFRLPLVLFPFKRFSQLIKAKKLIMCRYDFFSELMLYGSKKDVSFYLFSASLKNKEKSNQLLLKNKFSLYDEVFCASKKDELLFKKLGLESVSEFEFRLLQISSRVRSANETLSIRPEVNYLNDYLNSFDKSQNLVIGSAWPVEMEIFKNSRLQEMLINGEINIVIAPHGLSDDFIDSITREISINFPTADIQTLSFNQKIRPGAIIINRAPGVLLESYTLFGHAFVGGGHGRSVHSLLEPFMAGAMVYCGPKTHRSTEYDFIMSYDKNMIRVISDLSSFADHLYSIDREKERLRRAQITKEYQTTYQKILDQFLC